MNILHVFIGGDNKVGGVQECMYLLCKYLVNFNHSIWSPYGWTPGLERLVTDSLISSYTKTSDPHDLMAFLAQQEIDIALIHSGSLNLLFSKGCIGFLSEVSDLPLVEVLHRSMPSQVAPFRVDRIITVSDHVRSLQDDKYHHLLTTIHNGIELNKFNPSPNEKIKGRKQFGIPENATVIGYLGRMAEEKGVSDILAIAPDISRHLEKPYFIFGGEGPQKPSLEKTASHLSIDSKFYGLIPPDEKIAFLAAIDVFVLPSRGEAFSVGVIEALAMGLPIVAYDQGPMREYFGSDIDTYFLAPPSDCDAFGKAIVRALSNRDESKRLSQLSINESKKFSIQKVIDQYKTLLLEVNNKYENKPKYNLTPQSFRYMGNVTLMLNHQNRAMSYLKTAIRMDHKLENVIKDDWETFRAYVMQYMAYINSKQS